MSDQDFRERVLSSIEDLKRTTERIEDRMERIEDRMERTNERTDSKLRTVEKDVSELHSDVKWIRGKLEGRQEATSNKDVKTAIWIALGSALAAIISLIKSFWA